MVLPRPELGRFSPRAFSDLGKSKAGSKRQQPSQACEHTRREGFTASYFYREKVPGERWSPSEECIIELSSRQSSHQQEQMVCLPPATPSIPPPANPPASPQSPPISPHPPPHPVIFAPRQFKDALQKLRQRTKSRKRQLLVIKVFFYGQIICRVI